MSRILTFGVYDYFHLGHLRSFQQCKAYADHLTVAVQDGEYILKYKPSANVLYSTEQRVEIISALRIVDEVVVYRSVCEETLESIDFDILALGEDHVGERFTAVENWCRAHGKQVVRLKRTPGISSTDIKSELGSARHDAVNTGAGQVLADPFKELEIENGKKRGIAKNEPGGEAVQ